MPETSDAFLQWFDKFSFFIESGSFEFLGRFTVVYIAALWISLIVWVTRDAIHRSCNIFFQIIAILLNVFLPIFGLILYLIIRPEKTMLEKYHEDLEYRLLEGGDDLCFSCVVPVKEGFSFCPQCGQELDHSCESCKKKFSRRWQICPYCGKKKEQQNKKKKSKAKKDNDQKT